MPDMRIVDLGRIDSLNDSDYVVVGSGNETYKATISTLKQAVRPSLGRGKAYANGVYHASDEGLYGYDTFTVNVQNTRELEMLSVSKNGYYTPSPSVDGFYAVSVNVGDGDNDLEALIYGTIVEVNSDVEFIRYNAFCYLNELTTASFPMCTLIGSYAFNNCINLTTVSFPVCTHISSNAFISCHKLISASFPQCSFVGIYAFASCRSMISAYFPECISLYHGAFAYCTNLETISFPKCTFLDYNTFASTHIVTASFPVLSSIGSYVFAGCNQLTTVSFPVCTYIGSYAFRGCTNLSTVSFPMCNKILSNAFLSCFTLISLYITASSVCSLYASTAFSSTPIGGYTSYTDGAYGSIFVPGSLVDAYKSATNWSYFSDRITAYTE